MTIPSIIAEHVSDKITQIGLNKALDDIVSNEPRNKLDELAMAILVALSDKASAKHDYAVGSLIAADFAQHFESYREFLPYKVTSKNEDTMIFEKPILINDLEVA